MNSIIRIIIFTKKFWRWYLLSIFLVMLISILSLVTPFISKQVVDLVVSNLNTKNTSSLNLLVYFFGLILFVDLSTTVFTSLNQYAGDLLSSKLKTYLYQRFYGHLLHLDVAYFDNEKVGTILNKMIRGVNSTAEFIKSMTNNFLPYFLTALVTIIVLAKYSIILSILLVILFPLYIFISHRSSDTWRHFEDKKNTISDISQGRVGESLSGIRVIKAFAREIAELKNLVSARVSIESLTRQQSKNWHTYDFLRRILLNVILFLTYVYIIYATYLGQYTIGEMTLLLQLVNQARFPLFAMSFILGQIQDAQASAKSYFEVMDQQRNIKSIPSSKPLKTIAGAKDVIAFSKVDFSYDKGRSVLSEVSFVLPAGKKLAIVGESGQGKSTLVNLLLRFYEPQSGSIKVFGQDISKVNTQSLHRHIAVVLQDTLLFSESVTENIRLSKPEATQTEVVRAAKLANAYEFIEKLPQKFNSEIGERGVKLSGGQKQRIAIARAVLKNAPIIVLDEATSSLDSKSESEVQKGLEKLMQGKTAIIIAHRLSTLAHADLVLVLENGRISQYGTQQELLQNKSGLYYKLVELQRLPLSSFDLSAS